MGFLSKLFGVTDSIEKQLEEQYVSTVVILKGVPPIEATRVVRAMIRQAKNDAIREGTNNLPNNVGDLLLEKSKTDEILNNSLAMKRGEGVRDEDYRWWWNMNDLERRLLLIDDNITRLAMLNEREEKGDSTENAAQYVRKRYPIYGDPEDTEHVSGDDRPLPYELKGRVNTFFQKMLTLSPANFQKDIEISSTFNALIRREIKNGRV